MNNQIEILDRVLGELQKNVARRAVEFFRYGWVILAGCFFHYLLTYIGKEEWMQAVWVAVPISCIILGVATGIGNTNRDNVSMSEKLLINFWAVLGLVMVYLSFVAPRLGFIPDEVVLPLIMTLMFVSVIITGLAIRHTATILLSGLWFIGSIIISVVPGEFYIHVLTLVVILGYLLPAYLIKVKFR